jgi:hypothetical protein
MPTFCRHNRLLQNCPICTREQHLELRPIVSPSAPRSGQPRESDPSRSGSGSRTTTRSGSPRTSARTGGGLRVRRLERGADDGYRSRLVPGLKSGADAERLAEEMAFAGTRLQLLSGDPPGLYAEVADAGADIEARTWLAFLIAYLGPLDGDEPFAGIERVRVPWSPEQPIVFDETPLGPRAAHEPGRDARTVDAYRAWAARAGSQSAAFNGEPAWTPERRFARVYERLALPGFPRAARFELLTALGRLGVYQLEAGALQLGGSDAVTAGAKRVLGIGDTMLLERRAADLAKACGLPLVALDVGLYNWERGARASLGVGDGVEPDPGLLDAARDALGL